MALLVFDLGVWTESDRTSDINPVEKNGAEDYAINDERRETLLTQPSHEKRDGEQGSNECTTRCDERVRSKRHVLRTEDAVDADTGGGKDRGN